MTNLRDTTRQMLRICPAMTDDENLRSLVEKSADTNLPRVMIGFAAEKLMALEVGTRTGAGYGEKNGFRLAQRDGDGDRDRETRAGTIIAVGVNTDGRREVLGMEIGTSEAEAIWTEFLRKLTRRGLRGVKLAVSDAHEGLKAAVSKVFSATWQRRRVHLTQCLSLPAAS
jgi:transposase-like protein